MRRSIDPTTGLSYLAGGDPDSSNAIFFLHGWACQATDYNLILPLLEANQHIGQTYRLMAPDLPGHGQTAAVTNPPPTITTCASSVLKLAHSLGIRHCILAGHSMSCRIVLEAWQQSLLQPVADVEVVGLVLIDGSHYKFRPKFHTFDSATATPEQVAATKANAFNDMLSERTPAAFRTGLQAHLRSLDQTCADSLRLSQIDYDAESLDGVLERLGSEGGDVKLLSLHSSEVNAELRRASMAKGQRTEWMEFLQATVPQASLHVITGTRHFPHVDVPEVVASRIVFFIESVEASNNAKV